MSYNHDDSLPPCEKCPRAQHCDALRLCCSSMFNFIETGVSKAPDEPSHELYDRIYGHAYKSHGYTIYNRNEFLKKMQVNVQDKTALCGLHLRNLYNSAVDEHIPLSGSEIYAEWDWYLALSNVKIAPMLLGAIGYEAVGDGAYVSYLYVRKHYQGLGLGGELLSKVEQGRSTIALYPDSLDAVKWYKGRGYEKSPENKSIMVKKIER